MEVGPIYPTIQKTHSEDELTMMALSESPIECRQLMYNMTNITSSAKLNNNNTIGIYISFHKSRQNNMRVSTKFTKTCESNCSYVLVISWPCSFILDF